ncbi:MAG: RNA polymerase factor sigma-54 [Eubacteriales bacterium]|nr:RNA polymerase factor sigma-54 [Eubacteriales bacterium]
MDLSLSQSQLLSPAMQTSLHLLQLNTMQLRDYICDLMLRNPVVELECPKIEYTSSPFEPYRSSSTSSNENQNPQDFRDQLLADKAEEVSAFHDLYLQVASMNLSIHDSRIMKYLIESLDDNGFLTEACPDIAAALHVSCDDVSRCIELLQNMEPAGIGAADLSDCLRLQIKRIAPEDSIALEIVRSFLQQMSKKQYAAIAKALGVSKASVMESCERIRTLNPKPLNGLGGDIVIHYIIPDFYIFIENNHQLSCTINDYYLPKITIDPAYRQLMNHADISAADRDYISRNYREASDITNFISYRKSTLQRMVEYILDVQSDFFLQGPGHQRPMSNRDVAQALSLHESTVSRAVSGKFFECKWGVFPLKSLFSHTLNQEKETGNTISAAQVQNKLQNLISNEPEGAAYSDQQLSDLLAEEGIQIARRTVTKYRKNLGIPSASRRNAKFSQ